MKKAIATLILLFATPLFALLSPLDQNIVELRAILESSQLKDNLKTSEEILDIWKLGNRYIFSTEQKQFVVEIQYLPQDQPAPRKFKLIFYKPKPIGS